MKKRLYAFVAMLAFFVAACSTTTHFSSQYPVDVYVDGQFIGKTPNASVSLSDGVWGDPSCYFIEADGQRGTCYIAREAKIGAIIGGFFLWPIWLWTYGPKTQQFIQNLTTTVGTAVQTIQQQADAVQPTAAQPAAVQPPQGYLDENGQTYYIDPNGEHYYLDPNGRPYYIGSNGQPYYK